MGFKLRRDVLQLLLSGGIVENAGAEDIVVHFAPEIVNGIVIVVISSICRGHGLKERLSFV